MVPYFCEVFSCRSHVCAKLNQSAALEEDLDKSPDKKPAINKLIDRAIPK